MIAFLVIGYGNELRGDDAVGPQVARRVAGWRRPQVDGLAVHQLTPELAPALRDVDTVVFVDACADGEEGEVCVRRLEAGPGAGVGHTSDPRWLVALTEAAYGRRPEAWLVTIPAADFGMGGPLSATAQAGMVVALRQINRLVSARKGKSPGTAFARKRG
jgi:hydrogenase maturation protease